jgi:hypothetical protein
MAMGTRSGSPAARARHTPCAVPGGTGELACAGFAPVVGRARPRARARLGPGVAGRGAARAVVVAGPARAAAGKVGGAPAGRQGDRATERARWGERPGGGGGHRDVCSSGSGQARRGSTLSEEMRPHKCTITLKHGTSWLSRLAGGCAHRAARRRPASALGGCVQSRDAPMRVPEGSSPWPAMRRARSRWLLRVPRLLHGEEGRAERQVGWGGAPSVQQLSCGRAWQ